MRNTIANELKSVLIVGGGRMGQAIAQGILHIDGHVHGHADRCEPRS